MGQNARILVVEDDAAGLERLKLALNEGGYSVETASTGAEGISRSRRSAFDLVVTDLCLPDMRGFEVIASIKEVDATTEVIAIADRGSVGVATEAISAGAFYVVEKPFELACLRLLVERALERRSLAAEGQRLRDTLGARSRSAAVGSVTPTAVRPAPRPAPRTSCTEIIGRSEAMRDLLAMIESVARSDANILIVGESGTGKELVADAIHARSLRATHNFVKVNCSALPHDLIENELFGHVRGAFTGAAEDKRGLIASAAGGSLLLDEITELPLDLQPKLLRVLQERQYQRLGSEKVVGADFRLLTSTNRRPAEALEQGLLREDLYYRIATITIEVPPLRERSADLQMLADLMMKRYAERYSKPIDGFTPAAYATLASHDWPGNVRELEHVVERAVLLARGRVIEAADLQLGNRRESRRALAWGLSSSAQQRWAPLATAPDDVVSGAGEGFCVPFGMALDEVERRVIANTRRGSIKAVSD
jgi:DNA-binding NtrC family response regulator